MKREQTGIGEKIKYSGRWMGLLGACLLLAGCGSSAAGFAGDDPGRGAAQPGQDVIADRDAGSGGQDVAADRDVVSTGQDVADGGHGASKEREAMSPVELTNEYERAAFFADRIYDRNGGNILVSPLSLELALGLVTEGASGETANELYDYLGTPDYGAFAKDYMKFAESLTRKHRENAEELAFLSDYSFQYSIANSVWVSSDHKLLKSYQDTVQSKFLAEVDSLNFREKPDESLERINSWCNEKTNGLIPEILTRDALDGDMAAILVNAVYFESPWVEKWGLKEHKFRNLDGSESRRTMLADTVTDYYENDKAVAFGKSYFNGFEFIGILPKAEGEFEIGDLDVKSLLESRTGEYEVRALMPKLDYETATGSRDIVEILKAQGVKRAFDRYEAQFDKLIEMNTGEVTYIDDIIQKCKIELDEEGTRAAAVTAVMVKCEFISLDAEKKVKEVSLDRPFAWLIYDNKNEKIVFLGKVTGLE